MRVVAQAEGYTELITQLCVWLQEITGFHTISLQPNSGSNGGCPWIEHLASAFEYPSAMQCR